MNPFWWPVRPSPQMSRELRRSGAHRERHYASIFFHSSSPEIKRRYQIYLQQLALAAEHILRTMSAFPLIVAMDTVDRTACHDLAAALNANHSVVVAAEHRVGDIVAALRRADLLISSRFHALVAAMPAAVPSIGIAMDERITNLFTATNQSQRLLHTEDPDLGRRIVEAVRQLDRADVRRASRATVAQEVQAIGHMGQQFIQELKRMVPGFPAPEHAPGWEAHMAALPADVSELLSAS